MSPTTTGVLCASTSLLFVIVTSPAARSDPDTCRSGFVWREASSGDHVCVTPQTRSQTAADNAAAMSRIDPNGKTYGKFTCLQGFVWREAFHGDTVCVTPETRSNAAADNAQARNRRVGSGQRID